MGLLLVDTDVASFLFKSDSRAEEYLDILQGNELALSFMTVAELFQWAAMRRWGDARIARLETALEKYLVLPVDAELCRRWGQLRSQMKAKGIAISVQDAWIAATALRYDLALVSHNGKDFRHVAGLELLSCSGK